MNTEENNPNSELQLNSQILLHFPWKRIADLESVSSGGRKVGMSPSFQGNLDW